MSLVDFLTLLTKKLSQVQTDTTLNPVFLKIPQLLIIAMIFYNQRVPANPVNLRNYLLTLLRVFRAENAKIGPKYAKIRANIKLKLYSLVNSKQK